VIDGFLIELPKRPRRGLSSLDKAVEPLHLHGVDLADWLDLGCGSHPGGP